jgi:hypothetical protein
MSYSFYCSKCKIDHPGECPPKAVALGNARVPITAHDWRGPVVHDLSSEYICAKCKKTERVTLVAHMVSTVDGTPLLPVGPCPVRS